MAQQKKKVFRRVKTPTVLQMEAVECGAASLGIVLAYFKRYVSLEELRLKTGVSRDGVKASNMVKAARLYDLIPKAKRADCDTVYYMKPPMIVHWNFNHFLVIEGFKGDTVYVNDPAMGQYTIDYEEFEESFTGVVIEFDKGENFKPGGVRKSMFSGLFKRIKGSWTAMFFIFLAGLALVIPGIVIPTFTQIFVDDILVKGMDSWLKPLLIGMFITLLMRTALMALQEYYLLKLETKLSLSSSARFIWHAFRLPLVFYSQREAADISERVGSNDDVANVIAEQLTGTAISLMMIIFFAALMVQYDLMLTLVGIAIAALNIGMLVWMNRSQTDASYILQQNSGKFTSTSMSGLQLIETLKASGAESDYFSKWGGHQAKLINSEQQLSKNSIWLENIPSLLSAINTTVILGLGGWRVIDGHLTMGMLVAFQSLMSSFLEPVEDMVGLGDSLMTLKADMSRLDDVMQYEQDDVYKNETKLITDTEDDKVSSTNSVLPKLEGYVELKDLSFGYNIFDPPLIEGLSLKMKPGTRVALVGGSGSGKSTVAKLICGLYKPWSGEILFDGRPRNEIPRDVLCNSLAMIDQDICMFKGSISENLTLWDSTVPQSQMIKAAQDACIHDAVTDKPGGYYHGLSEGGTNFSGGQRQRLEIARAMVGDPSILVLDEATSALDPLTERNVDLQLRRRGCTCILVAHRLSTIRDCDEIIVLDKGKVMQRGTHEQLLKEGGHYSDLIKAH